MHPRAEARFLRLELTGTLNNQPAEIREITLRGPEETVSSLALYQLAAGKARPGHYPDHLRGRQVYWTITGLPGDSRESLLDEYGNLEPYQGMGSLMPYLFMNGRLLSAFDAERVTQTLEDGALPLPTVQWQLGPLSVSIQAFTWGGLSDAATFVRYLIANVSKEKQAGRFFLAVRPVQVNPAWQYGGLSPIQSLLFQPGENFTLAKVNGVDQYVLYSRPDGFGATAFDQSDVVKFLARGQLPPAQGMDNGGDLISGAVEYNFALEPGAASNWIVAAPLHGSIEIARAFVRHGHSEMTRPDDAFTRHWNEQGWFWREQLGPVRIEMPEQFVADAMRAQIGYILVNRDGVAIQPGSRNYKRTWIRDGSLTGAAMLRMGLFQPIREYLEWYAARVQPDGLVPPILNNDGSVNTGFGSNLEYDSQGQFIYALMEDWRFTKDTEFLKRHFPQIRAALEYLVKLREQTLAPDYMRDEPARERFVGILPKSFSHEGYAPPMHSYWDDFWALKGWKDGAEAARAVGDEAAAQWAEEQYKLLRDSVVASIEKTIAYRQIDFIPGCAEKGDPDPTSTAIAFFPCEEQANLPPTILRQTFERYFKEIRARKIAEEGCTFTPYEIRSITPFVELGEKERAVELLDYMLTFRRPVGWQHWAEVVLGDARKASYIGDMPHTWVGSGYVNALRGMLAEERDGILILLAGAPEKWLAGRGLNISNLPTWYGPLNLKARLNQNTLTVSVAGAPEVKGLELRWPRTGKPARVRVNGADWTDWDALACRLPAGDHEVQAEW
jgi:hypothetical protein